MGSQLGIAATITLLVTMLAYRRGSLSISGGVGGMLVGTLILGFGGWEWGVLLGLFFVSSSLLSHYKQREKQTIAEKFDKGHRRDLGQALANGGPGALLAVLSAIWPAPDWMPMFIGVMATVTADTWATELGTLSRRPPRLITSGGLVPVGTSGGVSLLGTAVSFAGGLLIGLAAGLIVPGMRLIPALLIGAVAGTSGSLFDSLLGATVQQIYVCEVCQKETEKQSHCGRTTRPLRGWSWLNNDLVNLLASIVGAGVALGVWAWLA